MLWIAKEGSWRWNLIGAVGVHGEMFNHRPPSFCNFTLNVDFATNICPWINIHWKLRTHFLWFEGQALHILNCSNNLKLEHPNPNIMTTHLFKRTLRASSELMMLSPPIICATQQSIHLTLDLMLWSCPFHRKLHMKDLYFFIALKKLAHKAMKN